MPRRFATATVCALLTVTPQISPYPTEADVSSSELFTGASAPLPQRVHPVEISAPQAAMTTELRPEPTAVPARKVESKERNDDALPRNAPVIARPALGTLARATGNDVEEKIGTAADAMLFDENYVPPPPKLTRETTCYVLQEVAAENDLPEALFTRLIWQESRFRHDAVSPVGAQGIAQFMPATAAERGLEDPFDPIQALPASAAFLRDLIRQFGNFGLAAAAYNGGSGRVSRWLVGQGNLPEETRNYVIQVTGRTAEHWATFAAAEPHPEAFNVSDCDVPPLRVALTEAREQERRRKEREAQNRVADQDDKSGDKDAVPMPAPRSSASWIAALSGNWSEKKARAVFASLQKKYPEVLGRRSPTVRVKHMAGKKAPKTTVGVSADTRAEAQKLCQRLKQAGGACVVRKDPA